MSDDFVREKIIQANPLVNVVQDSGVRLMKKGPNELAGLCPFHKEKTPSFTVTVDKQAWWCFGCQKGGSVIDFLALHQNRSPEEVFKELAGKIDPRVPLPPPDPAKSKEVAVYKYHDEHGNLVCEVVRYEPKTFRQRHPDGKGGWIWNMDGVRRVPYNLAEILKAPDGALCSILEGEKDVETMRRLKFIATTNIGGAGKWMDAYSNYFKGKSVILWRDNDEPGRKHAEQVLESLGNVAKDVRICSAPEPYKDITEYVEALEKEDPDPEAIATSIYKLVMDVPVLTGGIVLPVKSMNEMEITYSKFTKESNQNTIDLAKWLPTLGLYVRGMVPGEVIAVLAGTGVGKTLLSQGLAISQAPLPVLLFELELPDTLTFERFVAMGARVPSYVVFKTYQTGQAVDWRKNGNLDHIYTCCDARLTPEKLREYIVKSELKIGRKPVLVIVDYMQLFRGKGKSRYESVSHAAEEIKIIAKETNTIILITSQIQRPEEDDFQEVTLHNAKESGSIENSSGLVLGAWREAEGSDIIWIKILKNTKGRPGVKIRCRVDGDTLVVKEAPFDPADVAGI